MSKSGRGLPHSKTLRALGCGFAALRLRVVALRAFCIVGCLSAGCATHNVNPPAARANTGYVDFYTDSNLALSWEVKRANEPGGELKKVFSEFKPIQGTMLRLAAPPGKYRFQVWFINLVTEGPQTVSVEVFDGKITPVQVALTAAGTTLVQTKDPKLNPGGNRLRRGNRFTYEPNQVFSIGLVAGTAQAYQPKERMPYFSEQP